MMTCPKCGASVSEDKAFCQDCGTPMSPASGGRPSPPVTDFGATIIVPRGPAAGTPAAPPPAPARTSTAEARPVAPPVAGSSASPSSPASPVAAATAGRPPASPSTVGQQPNQSRTVLYVLLGAGALLLVVLIVVGLLLSLT